MIVYFFTTQPSITHAANILIMSSLQKAGAKVRSNLEGLSMSEEFPKNVDAIILLAGNEEQTVGSGLSYTVALGVAYRKPMLYLLPKRSVLPDEVSKLAATKDMKKLFKAAVFTPKKGGAVIASFIDQYVFRTDKYAIKFTLRLNSDLERYLLWKSKRAKMSKADFARKLIEDCMNEDEKFKRE